MRTVQVAIQVVTLRLIGWLAVAMTLAVLIHIAHRHEGQRITWADSWREAEPQVLPVHQKPSAPGVAHRSKLDGTARKLDRYAREAQPAWELEHPGRECPSSVDELNSYIGASDSLDLWGHPIAILCRTTTPRGLSAFSVMSAGEDGQLGTEDDLRPF